MAITVSIQCPACAAAFPIDPDKVPLGGARTECTECGSPFRVDPDSWGGGGSEQHAPWVADPAEGEGQAAWEEASQAFEGLTVVQDGPEAPVEAEGEWDAPEAPAAAESEWDADGAPPTESELDAPEAPASAESQWEAPEPASEFGSDDGGTVDLSDVGVVESPPEANIGGGADGPAEGEGPERESDVSGFDDATFETATFEATSFEATPFDETAFEATSFEAEGTRDHTAPEDGPPTGELVTDQWADLVDAGEDGEGEISSDWGSGEGDSWVLETEEDLGLGGGGLEVERLDTVEDQVRAAKDDPDLTAPAEGLDTNEVSGAGDGPFADVMSGHETMLPPDALEIDSPPLDLEADPGRGDFEAPSGDFEAASGDFGAGSEGFGYDSGESPAAAESTGAGPVADEGEGASTFQFGRRDPHDKARRLARVLVSDMITYNPDRHTQAHQNGSVRQDFEDEIQKSWAEYVEQVGPELAESTDYWRDALNEILAGGEPLF